MITQLVRTIQIWRNFCNYNSVFDRVECNSNTIVFDIPQFSFAQSSAAILPKEQGVVGASH
ncbi:hypothetical protein BH10PLA2_BH10PLA2_36640 [soil metagenome]